MEWIPNRIGKQLTINLTKVLQLYAQASFIIQTFLMDMEFEKVRDLLPQVNEYTSTTNEHMAEVKRRMRTVKERCRRIVTTLLLPYFPQQLIVNLVQFVTMWLNTFLKKLGFPIDGA